MARELKDLIGPPRFHWPSKTLWTNLEYPRIEDEDSGVKYIEVGLLDVRAADDIRISYDFERDGYVIEQASKWEWEINDEKCDPDWAEVAFVQAWGRDPRRHEENG